MCSRGGRRLPEDRISSLPDDVLLVIMSFLPFKEVVNSSLLSRRWLNLWVHTPLLHFHLPFPKATVTNDRERQHYVNWVNRFLRRHEGRYLEVFKIVCDLDKHNQKDIDNWLVFALAKKVQCLELNLLRSGRDPCNLYNNYVFPGRFLNSGNGKANLLGGGGKSRFSQFDLKCLKSLSLKSVDVTGEAINFFLRNCPFLERVEVVGSLELVNLLISDPSLVLKYLTIKYCPNLKVLGLSNFNLVSLDISPVGDLTLTNLPMLVEFFILKASSDRLTRFIAQTSSCLSQLEALTLEGYKLEDVTQLSNYDQLTNLKRLAIHVGARNDESLTTFLTVVNSCPRLEEFVLKLYWFSPKQRRTRRNIPEVERSSSSSLKNKSLVVFEFVGYNGRVRDDELIMHVVANAVSLEKIIIDPRNVNRLSVRTEQEEKAARRIGLQWYEALRRSIPPHVHLLIR